MKSTCTSVGLPAAAAALAIVQYFVAALNVSDRLRKDIRDGRVHHLLSMPNAVVQHSAVRYVSE